MKKRPGWLGQRWWWRCKTWLDSGYIWKIELAVFADMLWVEKEESRFQPAKLWRESSFTELGNPGGKTQLGRKIRGSDLDM